jgi:signal peptidase I
MRRFLARILPLFLTAGAGHFILGRWRRGTAFFAADMGALVLASLGAMLAIPIVCWLFFAASIAIRIASAVDAKPEGGQPFPRTSRAVLACIGLLVTGVIVSHGIRTFMIEAFKIPAGSMIPTLVVGDHIFARKTPFVPARGDIIVFKYPVEPEKDFIKRVIAIGGDTIEMRDGMLYVNNAPVPRKHVDAPCSYEDNDERGGVETRPCDAWDETNGGVTYRIYQRPGESARGAFRPVTVPANQTFVMGDNRDNSLDSRSWGTVPAANVRGKALFIWWSAGPKGVRWDRINREIR